jgi:2-polyprenyl-3-methyl-5-hydroxy-6-metoxy-1,4-benzoquinol methylase
MVQPSLRGKLLPLMVGSRINMSNIPCRLCQSDLWELFSFITFGVWKEKDNDNELLRDSKDYPLGQCQHCGHVQVVCEYTTELFTKLYFHSKQEAVMWHEALVGSSVPYQEMVKFACNDKVPEVVVDFGCGEGKLLSVVNSIYMSSKLVGIDFNDRFSLENADYLPHNLNELSDLSRAFWPNGIDLATASHVLEHIVEPVVFLSHIKSHLSNDGAIFIEVPDFSHRHDLNLIGKSNLINLQHIHYFTADSLSYVAEQVGLQVVNLQHVTTGYIPRLQALFKRATTHSGIQTKSAKFDGINAVSHYQATCREHRKKFAHALFQQIELDKVTGLWGLGADFYELLNESPLLIQAIKSKSLILFDYAHKGKSFLSQTILCSSDIPKQKFNVFICPMLVETTMKMRDVSQHWQNVVEFNDTELTHES